MILLSFFNVPDLIVINFILQLFSYCSLLSSLQNFLMSLCKRLSRRVGRTSLLPPQNMHQSVCLLYVNAVILLELRLTLYNVKATGMCVNATVLDLKKLGSSCQTLSLIVIFPLGLDKDLPWAL